MFIYWDKSIVTHNFSDKHISKPDILHVYDYNKETLACSRHDIADKLLIFGVRQDAQYYNNNKETGKWLFLWEHFCVQMKTTDV